MWNTTINELCIDVFIISNNDGIKCVSNLVQLEPCNDMFKVISDIMAHCYDMWNAIINAINFCNAKKMNCALMFIMSNHYGRKCINNLSQLEKCNVMLKVISDIVAHCYDLWNTRIKAINFCIDRNWIVHWCLSWAAIIIE